MQDPIQLGTASPVQYKKSHMIVKVFIVIIILLLLAFSGWLIWQLGQSKNQDSKTTAANAQLQQKVDDLTKQLAAAKAASSSGTATKVPPPVIPTTCSPVISQDLKANLAAAVGSQNYAALVGYMASSVNVVIAASGKTGSESATQAVSDMSYLNSATGSWNFSVSAATMNLWATHFYKAYFTANFFAGEAASHQVVSFQFDCDSKVNGVFMASDASLLEQ